MNRHSVLLLINKQCTQILGAEVDRLKLEESRTAEDHFQLIAAAVELATIEPAGPLDLPVMSAATTGTCDIQGAERTALTQETNVNNTLACQLTLFVLNNHFNALIGAPARNHQSSEAGKRE